jgi:hypothetical protein
MSTIGIGETLKNGDVLISPSKDCQNGGHKWMSVSTTKLILWAFSWPDSSFDL